MNSFKLNSIYILILRLVKNKVMQKKIAERLNTSQARISQRLTLLEREGYITRTYIGRASTIKLTQKGEGAIQGAYATSSVSQAKDDNVYQNLNSRGRTGPASSHEGSIPSAPPISSHAKRANGFKLYASLFLTEYTKLEAKLAGAGIIYEPKKIRHSMQYIVEMEGYKLIFTTRKLIIYCDDALYDFKMDSKLIINEELLKANAMLSNFVRKTKIRLVEEYNKFWIRIAHYEIAHTNSGVAEGVTEERKGLIPLAFDPITLKIVSWADRSLNLNEWEFSDYRLERKVAAWTQAIRDGKLDPLEDHKAIGLMAKVITDHEDMIKRNAFDAETVMQTLREIQSRLDQAQAKSRQEEMDMKKFRVIPLVGYFVASMASLNLINIMSTPTVAVISSIFFMIGLMGILVTLLII